MYQNMEFSAQHSNRSVLFLDFIMLLVVNVFILHCLDRDVTYGIWKWYIYYIYYIYYISIIYIYIFYSCYRFVYLLRMKFEGADLLQDEQYH